MNGCEIIDLLNRYGVLVMIRTPREQYADACINHAFKPMLAGMGEPHADPFADMEIYFRTQRELQKLDYVNWGEKVFDLTPKDYLDHIAESFTNDYEIQAPRIVIHHPGRNIGRGYALSIAGMDTARLKDMAERMQQQFEERNQPPKITIEDRPMLPANMYDNRPWWVIAADKGGIKNKRNKKR